MKKRNKILITFALLIAAIGGIFLAVNFGALKKRTVEYSQPQATQAQSEADTSAQSESEQNAQVQQEQLSEENIPNQDQAKSDQKIAQTNSPDQNKQADQSKQIPAEKNKTTGDESPSKSKSSDSNVGEIKSRLVSWGFQKSSGRKIDTVIVHTSYDAEGNDPYSVDGVIAEWKAAGVAPHYLIARDGTIYQLVSDQNIAYHAGVSKMPDGRTNVNAFSIGVEMINTKDGKFTDDQYSALNKLIETLKSRYSIKYVLGHDDIAPGRKTDPWGMDWSKVDR